MNNLTPTMQQAVEFARQHGGKLHRHPGGYWQGPEFHRWGTTFNSGTVSGLVSRGAASYTNWKEGRNYRFPIEITLTTNHEENNDQQNPPGPPGPHAE